MEHLSIAQACFETIAAIVGLVGLRTEHQHPHRPEEESLWLTSLQANAASSVLLVDGVATAVTVARPRWRAVHAVTVQGIGIASGLAFVTLPYSEAPAEVAGVFASLVALALACRTAIVAAEEWNRK